MTRIEDDGGAVDRPIPGPVYRGLDRAGFVLALAALLLPAPLFGGIGFLGLFLIRLTLFAGFSIFCIKHAFFSRGSSDRAVTRAALFACGYAPFLAYVAAQAWGGRSVLVGRVGSLTPWLTVDSMQQLIWYGLALAVFTDALRTKERVTWVARLLALEIAVLAPWGSYVSNLGPAYQSVWYGIITPAAWVTRYATFLNPNVYGGFLALAVPLLLMMIVYYALRAAARRHVPFDLQLIEKAFFAMLLAVMLYSISAAEARAALVWALAFFPLAVLLFLRARPLIWAFALAVLAGAGVFFLRSPQFDPERLGMELQGRLLNAYDALGALVDFPFFGYGLGASRYALPFYQTYQPENAQMTHPANHHLELLIEAGPFAYVAFLLPIIGLALVAAAAVRRSASRWERVCLLLSAAAVLSSAFPSLVDNYLGTPALAMLFVLYLAFLCRAGSFDLEAFPRNRVARPVAHRGRALFFLFAIAGAGWLMRAAVLDYRADCGYYVGSKEVAAMERSVRYNPDNAFAWFELGRGYYEEAVALLKDGRPYEAVARKAEKAYDEALRHAPTFHMAWTELGRTKVLLGERKPGVRLMGHAVRLNPFNRDKYLFLVHTCARLSESSPWLEERPYFRSLARYWVGETRRLARPLKTDDMIYLKNGAEQLTGRPQELLLQVIREYYKEAGLLYD